MAVAQTFKANSVLCFITSARNSLSKDNIILNSVAYYSSEVVYAAKEEIFSFCDERPIKRKASAEYPNPAVANVRDILNLLDKVEGKISLPTFVATEFNSLPPSNFDSIAPVLCSLRDEITLLREELSQLKKNNLEHTSRETQNSCMQQDISEIKLMVRNLEKTKHENESQKQKMSHLDTVGRPTTSNGILKKTRTSAAAQSEDVHPQKYSRTLSVSSSSKQLPQPPIMPQAGVIRAKAKETMCSTGSQSLSSEHEVTEQSENGDNNEWKIVERNRRRRGNRELNVAGTRTSVTGLSGVERVFDLFVGGCNVDTCTEDIKDYCKNLEVNLKKVEILETKSDWYRAFKISMLQSDREKLMMPDSWPQGVFVRKYFKARLGRGNFNNRS